MSPDSDTIEFACAIGLMAWTLIVFVRLALQWWGVMRAPGETRCAHCGHTIGIGGSKICPECGEDVRVMGLISPYSMPRPRFFDYVIFLGLLVTPVAVACGEMLARELPFGWYYQANAYVDAEDLGLVPQSGAYVTVQAFGYGRYHAKVPDLIRVFLNQPNQRNGSYLGMTVTPKNWTAETWSPLARRVYDTNTLLATLGPGLANVPPKRMADVIARVDGVVRQLGRGDFSPENSCDLHGRDTVLYAVEPNIRLLSVLACVGLAWAVVYLGVHIVWRLTFRYYGPWWLREAREAARRAVHG